MESEQKDISLFDPDEMGSPFDTIKETDDKGNVWWNSRKLMQWLEYVPKNAKMGAYHSLYVPEKAFFGTY